MGVTDRQGCAYFRESTAGLFTFTFDLLVPTSSFSLPELGPHAFSWQFPLRGLPSIFRQSRARAPEQPRRLLRLLSVPRGPAEFVATTRVALLGRSRYARCAGRACAGEK